MPSYQVIQSPFGAHVAIEHHACLPFTGNEQWVFAFENGMGASVITGEYTYGGSSGLWELAVFSDGHICYHTPLTDDVIGWLSELEVTSLLDEIQKMSPCKEEH